MTAEKVPNNSNLTWNLTQLIKETGYELKQFNGQRYYGPRPGAAVPPKGCEVFVAKLPRDCYEDELVPFFSAERIYVMRLLMDFSGTNRGFAYITYDTPEAARQVVRQLNGREIRPGHPVVVVMSLDNCRLYLGNIPRFITKEQLDEKLKSTVNGITDVVMYQDYVNRSANRGYAFVELESHRMASLARRRLVGRLSIAGQSISVDWALPEHSVPDQVMKKVKVLHVRNIHQLTKEKDLCAAAMAAVGGPIGHVKKLQGCAFIHFLTRKDAEKALDKLQNIVIDGLQLEVSWAKPVADRNTYAANKVARARAFINHSRNMDMYQRHIWLESPLHVDSSSGYGSPGTHSLGSPPPPPPSPSPPPPPPPPQPSAKRWSSLKNDYALAPARLEAICLGNNWAPPEYIYEMCLSGKFCVGRVRLPMVGAPLFGQKQELNPPHTPFCQNQAVAHVTAAQLAIEYIMVLSSQLFPAYAAAPSFPMIPSQFAAYEVAPPYATHIDTPYPVTASPFAIFEQPPAHNQLGCLF